jgi:hypothetical protein
VRVERGALLLDLPVAPGAVDDDVAALDELARFDVVGVFDGVEVAVLDDRLGQAADEMSVAGDVLQVVV